MLGFKLGTLLKNDNGEEICSFSSPSLFLNSSNFYIFFCDPMNHLFLPQVQMGAASHDAT